MKPSIPTPDSWRVREKVMRAKGGRAGASLACRLHNISDGGGMFGALASCLA
jgi:hypothetical protein